MRAAPSLLALITAVCLGRAEPKFVNEQYDLVKVADGTYSFFAPESDSGVVQSNCTVVIGEDAVLLIDSGQFPSLAERMLGDIKKLTSKPVRYLVNTHWHFDHIWGNAIFRDAYPGLAIISTEFTREPVEEQSPKFLVQGLVDSEKQIKEFREMVAKDRLPDGRPLTDEIKRSLNRTADTLEHIAPDVSHAVNAPPTVGFEKEPTINLGKRLAKVIWLGRANTGGDAVTWVPDVKLLATGDAVVYPAPFAFGSYMTEWPVTLQKMVDMNAAIIVPGHGPVMRDASYLKTQIEMFQTLTAQVKEAVAQGLSLEDTRKKVKLEEFSQRLGGDTFMRRNWFRSAFLDPAVDRACQEATGKMKPEASE